MMFEKGKESERGRCPLSAELPSLAINPYVFLLATLAGEAIKG
jgi:hypothetical protein